MEDILKNPFLDDEQFSKLVKDTNYEIEQIKRITIAGIEYDTTRNAHDPDLAVHEKIFFLNHAYRISIIQRIHEITKSFIFLWNNELYIGCYCLSRALLETFSRFIHCLELMKKSRMDLSKIEEILLRSNFGSNFHNEYKPYHINDSLRSFKKELEKGKASPEAFEFLYSALCEVIHPNGFGLTMKYLVFSSSTDRHCGISELGFEMKKDMLKAPLQAFTYYPVFKHYNDYLEKIFWEFEAKRRK